MHDPRMVNLVEARSSKDLRRTGSIYDYATEGSICEHQGIHHFYIGQTNVMSDKKSEHQQIDPLKQVISIISYKGNVFIDYPNKLKYRDILVNQFIPVSQMDASAPIVCYVKIGIKAEKIPCKLYLKNNNMALVELDREYPGLLVSGQYLVFYNRATDKGKVLASALVEAAGLFDETGYNTLPARKEETDESQKESSKKNQYDKLGF